MNNEQQKKLLIEIMEADEKDGLYKINNMKLYTESQVLNMLNMTDEVINGDLYTYDEIIKFQTPIELPSDEEIEQVSNISLLYPTDKSANFRIGAKWMKEQILNQNK